MNKLHLAALLPLALMLEACPSAKEQCAKLSFIPAVPAPSDAPETAENKYDTPATVARVGQHNAVVSKACGFLPAPQQ